jgi:hypothetical protein
MKLKLQETLSKKMLTNFRAAPGVCQTNTGGNAERKGNSGKEN